MSHANTTHPSWDALVDYWLGDGEAAADAIDAHLMQCDACGQRVDELRVLSRGVRDAFKSGLVPTMMSVQFVDRLKASGRRVREYRVPHNGSITCSVAPDDELLISHLSAPLQGVTRLDAVLTLSLAPGEEQRLHDVPFDAQAGEVVFTPRTAEVHQQPTHDFMVRLIAVDDAGEREVGRYLFHHQAARPV
jgi:hypothetical protein